MKQRHILMAGLLLLILLCAFPWFQDRADRDVTTFNRAKLKSLALQIEQIATQNGGQLSNDWEKGLSADDVRKTQFKMKNGDRVAWMIVAVASADRSPRSPILIAPESHLVNGDRRRLVLLWDFAVDDRPESELSVWIAKY